MSFQLGERERERGTLGNPKILAGFFGGLCLVFVFESFYVKKVESLIVETRKEDGKKKELKNQIEWEWKWREREGDEEVLQRFSQSS